MDRIQHAICDIDETAAELVFTIDAKRKVDQHLERSYPDKNTRRSRELSAAVQGEDVRLLIQECLQQQPSKRWQIITLRYRDVPNQESHTDTVILHHYYSLRRGEIKYETEVFRLGPDLPKKKQTMTLQDMMVAADRYLKQLFDQLGFSYENYKSPLTEKDYRAFNRFLSSKAALVRPTGGKSIREMYDPSISFDVVQDNFRDVVIHNTILSIVDSFSRMKDVQNRTLQIFRERPQVYVLMLHEMFFPDRSINSHQSSRMIEPTDIENPFGSVYELSPEAMREYYEMETREEGEYMATPFRSQEEEFTRVVAEPAAATPRSQENVSTQSDAESVAATRRSQEKLSTQDASVYVAATPRSQEKVSIQDASEYVAATPRSQEKVSIQGDAETAVATPRPQEKVSIQSAAESVAPRSRAKKIRNPFTNRCILIGGPTYLQHIALYGIDKVNTYKLC